MVSNTSGETVPCAHRAKECLNSKRLIICCDGTWNNSNDGASPASNVSRLASAVAHKCCSGKPQVVYYHPGAGTEASWMAKKLGGLLGMGVAQDIAETYRFVCDNYNPGDEIILTGFSRGAFTARSVADMICNLGFLNRAGLDHLAEIFQDYETWQDWGNDKKPYHELGRLAGFTLENYDQLYRKSKARETQDLTASQNGSAHGMPHVLAFQVSWKLSKPRAESKESFAESMAKVALEELNKSKDTLYKKIKNEKSRVEIAKLYREELLKHRLVLVERTPGGGISPLAGRVRAVGIWDTVGSLGIPKGPLGGRLSGRSKDEIRFTSLEVHDNIEHAFHAIALDEYRTAFSPTLWELGEQGKTNLRQVWFCGNHGDVGGGWEDEQAANIALAWMADQLTSVGVEFSRPEMQRTFFDVHTKVVPEKWAMGDIHNPPTSTAWADDAIGLVSPQPRMPGLYRKDEDKTIGWSEWIGQKWRGDKPSLLNRTCEFVHPSVRIRYQCGGPGPDGEPAYRCPALIDNGYHLEERAAPPAPRPQLADARAVAPYRIVGGVVEPYWDETDLKPAATAGQQQQPLPPPPRVQVERPDEAAHVLQLAEPQRSWVWKRPAPAGSKDSGEITLEEEQIGIWERLYMKVQEELVDWRPLYVARQAQTKQAEEAKKWAVTRVANSTVSGAGSLMSKGLSSATAFLKKKTVERLFLQWGYHDLIVWQRGMLAKHSAAKALAAPRY